MSHFINAQRKMRVEVAAKLHLWFAPSPFLPLSSFLCNLPPHTHTRIEILSNIFPHNSPHGTNEATFSLKKMRFARFWMQAACKQPFPIPYFSLCLFYSFYLFPPLPAFFIYPWAYPLTAKTALTSEKVGAGQLIRNSSQSACSADGAYEQRSMALKLKVLRCNYPSSSRYISYIYICIYVYMYVVQLSVIFRCAGQITRRFCLQLSPDSQHVDISCVNQGTLKARNKGSSSSGGKRDGGRREGRSFSSFLAAAH